MLSIQNLYISIENKEILKGLNLKIDFGEIHAIMGPNGAGKTTLVMGLMGASQYKVKNNSSLEFSLNGKNLAALLPEERARLGLLVGFQQPIELTGVSVLSFLRTAYKALYPEKKITLSDFKEQLASALNQVNLSEDFMYRSLNEGFSGGEKKRAEMAQLLVLKPKIAILDEIDSGLDIDSLKIVAKTIEKLVKDYNTGVLLITHYQRILHHLSIKKVHVLIDGKIKKTGKIGLVKKIEKGGYATV